MFLKGAKTVGKIKFFFTKEKQKEKSLSLGGLNFMRPALNGKFNCLY